MSPRFKKIGKIRLGSKLSLDLIYILSLLIQAASYIFHRVEFKKPLQYPIWRIFMVGFRVFMRTRLNIKPYSPLKSTKVGFNFIGPNFLSRAEDLAAVTHLTQAVVVLGFKVGFRELRLEPKFLNHGLCLSKK